MISSEQILIFKKSGGKRTYTSLFYPCYFHKTKGFILAISTKFIYLFNFSYRYVC